MKNNGNYSDKLKQMGLKSTPMRLAILSYLSESELPLEVAKFIEHLEKLHISFDKVNVYRNLETFVQKGIAKKVDLQDGKYYYERASDCSHLVCEKCGDIKHIHMEENHELEHALVQKTGFHISQHVSDFFGTCENCQKKI